MPIAAVYCRVSSDEQASNYSLDTQADACRQHAASLGYTVTHELRDDHTGTTLDRPELERLRDLAEQRAIDAVIVHDPDRLARRLALQLVLEDEFRRANVQLLYVNGHYDDSPEGRFMSQIRGAVAEFELAKILERFARGRRGRLKAGHVIVGSQAPFGYTYIPRSDADRGHLEVNEPEAAIVRQIFRWYVYGDDDGIQHSEYSLASKLSKLGIPSRWDLLGKRRARCNYGMWAPAAVHKLLANETYAGTWHYGKTNSRACRNEAYSRPRAEWTAVDVPAIVDRDLWQAAQDRMASNVSHSRRNTHHEYLMRRRLTCATCGGIFSTHPRKVPSYVCPGLAQGMAYVGWPVTCHHGLRTSIVDALAWDYLAGHLSQPERIIAGLRQQQAEAAASTVDTHRRAAELRRELADLERQQAEMLDLYHAASAGKSVVAARLDALAERATARRRELDALTSDRVRNTDTERVIQAITTVDMAGLLADATFEQRAALIALFDVRGVVHWGPTKPETTITLTSHLPPATVAIG